MKSVFRGVFAWIILSTKKALNYNQVKLYSIRSFFFLGSSYCWQVFVFFFVKLFYPLIKSFFIGVSGKNYHLYEKLCAIIKWKHGRYDRFLCGSCWCWQAFFPAVSPYFYQVSFGGVLALIILSAKKRVCYNQVKLQSIQSFHLFRQLLMFASIFFFFV